MTVLKKSYNNRIAIRNVISTTLILCVLCVSYASAQSQQNIQDARQQLEKLQTEFNTNQKKEQNISTNIGALEEERKKLNRFLIVTADRVKKGEETLSGIERQLARLSKEEKVIRRQMAQRHSEIAGMLAVMQRMGRQPPPVMTTHRDDALKMVRSAMLLSSVFPQLKSKADKLSNDLTKLVKIISTTRTQAAYLRLETKKLNEERKRIAQLISAKKTRILSQRNELQIVKQAAQRFSRNSKNLKDLIKKLDNEVSKTVGLGTYQKELAAGKSGLQSKINPKTGKNIEFVPEGNKKQVASLINPARIKPAIAFEKAKGLLPLPASGKRIKSFGTPNKYGGKAKGITLGTRQSGQVTSPSDGWVVYAGPFRSYGKLLIINAGGGYHILLAGMDKIDVATGQFVLAGEPVATMGATKVESRQASQDYDTKLYVEFRKNGQPIDPDPWWSKGNRKAQG